MLLDFFWLVNSNRIYCIFLHYIIGLQNITTVTIELRFVFWSFVSPSFLSLVSSVTDSYSYSLSHLLALFLHWFECNALTTGVTDILAYFQNNVCWLRGYLIILKLLAGIEMVARPVTFEIVDNEAAVTFGVTFEMVFVANAFPITENNETYK